MIDFPIRLDLYLVKKGSFPSRTKAEKAIKAGLVSDEKGVIYKHPAYLVKSESSFMIKDDREEFASRAALKLKKAAEVFSFSFKDGTVIDVGASTGGFTDYSLKQGADKVYAVDVGHDQLIDRIKKDARVKNYEGYNFRYADPNDFLDPKPNIAVVDVSFISLELILPALFRVLSEDGQAILLFKPQFEAGRHNIGNRGIVHKWKAVWIAYQRFSKLASEIGFHIYGFTESPIKGAGGNREFLVYLSKNILKREAHLPTSIAAYIEKSYRR